MMNSIQIFNIPLIDIDSGVFCRAVGVACFGQHSRIFSAPIDDERGLLQLLNDLHGYTNVILYRHKISVERENEWWF